jgi:hypothetical protein
VLDGVAAIVVPSHQYNPDVADASGFPPAATYLSIAPTEGIAVFAVCVTRQATLAGTDRRPNLARGDVVDFQPICDYVSAPETQTVPARFTSSQTVRSEPTPGRGSFATRALVRTLAGPVDVSSAPLVPDALVAAGEWIPSHPSLVCCYATNISVVLSGPRRASDTFRGEGRFRGMVYTPPTDTADYGFLRTVRDPAGSMGHAFGLSTGLEVYFRREHIRATTARSHSTSGWSTRGQRTPRGPTLRKGELVELSAKWVDGKPQARDIVPLPSSEAGPLHGTALRGVVLAVAPPLAFLLPVAERGGPGVQRVPAWRDEVFVARTRGISFPISAGQDIFFTASVDISTHAMAVNLELPSRGCVLDGNAPSSAHTSSAASSSRDAAT